MERRVLLEQISGIHILINKGNRMPFSNKEGKDFIKKWLKSSHHSIKNVLDLGAGSGTYYNYYAKKHKILSNATWTAVEVWNPYIEEFSLETKYNRVINEDIRKVDYKNLGTFDLTFAGDVLEHISKDEAVLLVNKILEISKILIISIPIVHFPQEASYGNPYEIHVKDDWSHNEVKETFNQITQYHTGNTIGVYILSNKNE